VAVYQGARERTVVLPRRARPETRAPELPRRRARVTARAGRRPSRTAMVLGGIVIAFVCAFFSLAQDVRVSAVGYEVDRLTSEHRDLEDELRDIRNELNRLGRAPAIRKLAIDAGLAPLSEPLIVPAR
jgi:hypothetical protein